jgi:hypothetical protein
MLVPKESIGGSQRAWRVLASAVELIVRIFSAAFLIGTIGCVFVIPIVAVSLFSVLFERTRTAKNSGKSCLPTRKKPRGEAGLFDEAADSGIASDYFLSCISSLAS